MSDYSSLVWEWNAKRQAINPNHVSDPQIEYLTPKGERKTLAYADLVDTVYRTPMRPREGAAREAFDRKGRAHYLRRRVQTLPAFIRKRFSLRLESLERHDPKEAVRWLFSTFERHVLRRVDAVNAQYLPQAALPAILAPLRDDFHLLPWADKKRQKRLAYKLANLMKSEFMREFDFQYEKTADVEFSTLYAYGFIASKATALNIAIPGWDKYCDESLQAEDALRAIARLQKEKWWLSKIRRIHDRWREHLMIATGYVSKVASPYCSDPCFREWVAQKKANLEFLNAMELEDQDTGERSSLLDKVMGSVSNPKIARHELMVRMRGFEDMANEMGLVGMFYTLTAPSRYHSTHVQSGKRNDKYRDASPRKTQKYLCKVWSRVRAKWGREGIRTFGFRVAEPHHDGTPHWHLLLFLRPEEAEYATAIFRKHALREDGGEPGAQEHRFTVTPIDEKFGSATGYIAKYISKNIDGYGMDGELDDESGQPVKEMAKRVRAWASRWSIRQFQQIGGAPVTTWRELRRLGSRELVLHPELEAARAAADAPDWPGYTNAQGGPFVPRDCLRVRLNYEYTEDGNDYGDTVAKITGIYCPYSGGDSVIFTRTTDYKIVPKRKPSPVENLTLEGRAAAPRSSVNNCTGRSASDKKTLSETAVQADKTVPDDSSVTELPLNIEDLRRYSRQQRQAITSRLKKTSSENSDQAFMRTARGLRTSIDDETALTWGPKVTAAKDMSLTPEEAEQRWREQLRIEAERRADNYAAAVAEYQKKKAEATLQQTQQKEASQKSGIPEDVIDSIGAQLRSCRIFVSDDAVRSIAEGARVRHSGGILAADGGRLREVKTWRAGEKDKPTSEYMAVNDLVKRWKNATKRRARRNV
ncbi:replication endonuclease [Klebsiella pneumoniae]|uniref:replication endonuclease n=1 Tax=Klebsiella pneumoniae TaxID=573 RepID=UPI000E34C6FE|nr:replication endonuclease [Klebsiella pneumoniae]HED2737413.1 replication endonuclease [Klebsiella michiganensis]MDK6835448.1 replication endonuclease [Klebsiella pneumoniae]HBQ0109571.1 replication endonuclease [Klebsiella pneumoniae]HBT6031306.1 replication endonuclease [Klebsiella pneumoniae]HBT6054085.1 replication endonuclease [Klebsiella pneumoniae]